MDDMGQSSPAAAARWRRRARDLLSLVAMVVVLLAARSSLADHYHVPSGSMLPTVEIGDRILVNKAAYGVRLPFSDIELIDRDGPARGDVVVLRSPEDGRILLKRIVGLPGDVVTVREGRLSIDGQPAPLRSLADREIETLGSRDHPVRVGPSPDFGPQRIPSGRYLVMGDNRVDSHDGRAFGTVSAGEIVGRAERVYWRGGHPTWEPL